MPLSPELYILPEIAGNFFKTNLGQDVIKSLILGRKDRDLVTDSKRLLAQFEKYKHIELTGLQNINTGCLVAFNHPNMDVLMPTFLDLIVKVNDLGRKLHLVMASEIMIFARLNDKKALPGSIKFMERFHSMYGGSIISTPTVTSRKDFTAGRVASVRKILEVLKKGDVVAISPEGHIEVDGKISPPETLHDGAGAIARFISKFNIPVVPVGFWGDKNASELYTKIGAPFFTNGNTDRDRSLQIMGEIANLLPNDLRGHFAK